MPGSTPNGHVPPRTAAGPSNATTPLSTLPRQQPRAQEPAINFGGTGTRNYHALHRTGPFFSGNGHIWLLHGPVAKPHSICGQLDMAAVAGSCGRVLPLQLLPSCAPGCEGQHRLLFESLRVGKGQATSPVVAPRRRLERPGQPPPESGSGSPAPTGLSGWPRQQVPSRRASLGHEKSPGGGRAAGSNRTARAAVK